MKLPSSDQATGVAIIAATALVGFVLWKLYRTGQSAAESVGETLSDVGDFFGGIFDRTAAAVHEAKGTIAGARLAIMPGKIGPSGGGSRQELQRMGTSSPDVMDYGDIPGVPYVGAFAPTDSLWGSYATDDPLERSYGGDGAFYAVSAPARQGPSAVFS